MKIKDIKKVMIEENKEELFILIGGFLNRLKRDDWGIIKDDLVILDKAKDRILREMIKDYKEYIY